MIVRHSDDVEARPVDAAGARGVSIRWLIAAHDEGAETFVMRQFEIGPGGWTPRHSHPWEHEVYVLAGGGAVVTPAGEEQALRPGDVVLVPPAEVHQFRADPGQALRFLCLIPARQPCG